MGRRLLPLYNWNDFCLPRQKTCPFLILCFELQVWKVLRFIIFMQKECPIPQPLISESVTVGNQSIWTFTIMDQLILIWHHRHSQFSLSYFRTRSHRILVHSQPKCIPSHIYEPVTDPVSTKKTINLWCPSSLKLSFFRKKKSPQGNFTAKTRDLKQFTRCISKYDLRGQYFTNPVTQVLSHEQYFSKHRFWTPCGSRKGPMK